MVERITRKANSMKVIQSAARSEQEEEKKVRFDLLSSASILNQDATQQGVNAVLEKSSLSFSRKATLCGTVVPPKKLYDASRILSRRASHNTLCKVEDNFHKRASLSQSPSHTKNYSAKLLSRFSPSICFVHLICINLSLLLLRD
jgi:hypothetical protein